MRIGILSDMKIDAESQENGLEKLEEVVEQMEEFEPDQVYVLGDMVKPSDDIDEDKEVIESIRKRLEQLDADIFYLAGDEESRNFDMLRQLKDAFDNTTFGMERMSNRSGVLTRLDSSELDIDGFKGRVTEDQLEILDNNLYTKDEMFIFVHHPLHYRDLENTEWEDYPEEAFCLNKREINDLIEQHGTVNAVFNGHVRDWGHEEYNEVPHFTVPPFRTPEGDFQPVYTELTINEEDVEVVMKEEEKELESWELEV